MRALVLTLAALLLMGGAPRASLPDIEDEVMCVQCGTALNVSTSPVADRQREFIRRRIDQGMTKEQIKDALVAEFGPGVLATPEDQGFGLAAYVVPPLLFLIAMGAVVLAARRWRGRPDKPAAEELGDADTKRLDADMARYEP